LYDKNEDFVGVFLYYVGCDYVMVSGMI